MSDLTIADRILNLPAGKKYTIYDKATGSGLIVRWKCKIRGFTRAITKLRNEGHDIRRDGGKVWRVV